jgi:uncharacterized protein (DUF952 family)
LMLVEIDPGQTDQMFQLVRKYFSNEKMHILQDLSGRDRCMEIERRYSIFHICQRENWLKSQASGEYQPDSLLVEGFIHCSQSDQYIEVANRYYKGVPDLVVLSIDPEKLTSEFRWEKSGDAYYPHIYGSINLEAVMFMGDLKPESDGTYRYMYRQPDSK